MVLNRFAGRESCCFPVLHVQIDRIAVAHPLPFFPVQHGQMIEAMEGMRLEESDDFPQGSTTWQGISTSSRLPQGNGLNLATKPVRLCPVVERPPGTRRSEFLKLRRRSSGYFVWTEEQRTFHTGFAYT